MKLSIIVPTTRDIDKLYQSLKIQTFNDFEVLVQREKGLVNARNSGWQKAQGEIIAFIDDDVILDKDWAKEVVNSFSGGAGCVMGGVITEKGSRDNDWSNPILKKLLKRIWNTQACNMAFSKNALIESGGFDTAYDLGVGEWSEPDLVFKVASLGFKVITNEKALLTHCPGKTGIYKKRGNYSYHRMKNFMLFSKRWLKMDLNLFAVIVIFNIYWLWKFLSTGNKNWLGGLWGTVKGLCTPIRGVS